MTSVSSAQAPDAICADFQDYYGCPVTFSKFGVTGQLSAENGYFKFGDVTCYGRQVQPAAPPGSIAPHATCARLPFDLCEVVTNLRREHYTQNVPADFGKITAARSVQKAYYFLRPILPVAVRKHLQRARLRGWEEIAFPRWPVDFTVDNLMEEAIALQLKATASPKIPFIWFWPDGALSCAILTHDVEDRSGRDFCGKLMDLDDEYGIKAAFHVVPEQRGTSDRRICATTFAAGVSKLTSTT